MTEHDDLFVDLFVDSGQDLREERKLVTEWTAEELFQKFAKLVYCRDYACAWNVQVKGKQLVHNNNYVPLGEDTEFKGICGRPEVGLAPEIIKSSNRKWEVATCQFRSARALKHIDFSKLLPQVIDRNPSSTESFHTL